ncbi:hypothetical protein B0H13DRAFT_1853278 [Mycena leptocephala]|nr:hypothetical protein B0H13DRAFT_1853278 [Mycena leptocephala]
MSWGPLLIQSSPHPTMGPPTTSPAASLSLESSSHAILPLDVYHELTARFMMCSGQLAKVHVHILKPYLSVLTLHIDVPNVARILRLEGLAADVAPAQRLELTVHHMPYMSNPADRCYQCVDQLPGQCPEQEVYDTRETACVGVYICWCNP